MDSIYGRIRIILWFFMIASLLLAALCFYFGLKWGEVNLLYTGILFIFLAAISLLIRQRYYDKEYE
ncbi:MAG: hypothetical protein ACW98W_20310 [Candidatus Hodarchaeales archaeon]|jgi:hypothetical protein